MNHARLLLMTLAVVSACSLAPARALTESQQDAAISSLQSTVAAQQTTINALVAKLQYVTASGHDLTLTGNLHVVSGAGKTNGTPNGLGNVIIGYNEARASGNVRTGSHNLILGTNNNYSSYGGIVSGLGNTASGVYASVVGGRNNTASGAEACVSGGADNTASASYTAIGGGQGYAASAAYAFLPTSASQSTIQSFQNQINSLSGTVSQQSKVTNLFSLSTDTTRSDKKTNTELSLTGVNLHIVNGLGATNGEPNAPYDTTNPVVNGLGNLIIGYNENRGMDGSGNSQDVRTGSHCLIVGDLENFSSFGGIVVGEVNTISNAYASVSGGYDNRASGDFSSVSGGYYGMASGDFSSISGGSSGIASGDVASVSGGESNIASGTAASVSGGNQNTVDGTAASVSGGEMNQASVTASSVSGGLSNWADGNETTVTGGENNLATGDHSSVSGGSSLHTIYTDSWMGGGY